MARVASLLLLPCRAMASIQRQVISPNLTLAPIHPVVITKKGTTWTIKSKKRRGLVLLLEYMNAKPKHIDKFIEFYQKRELDVLAVSLKPWQLFIPTRGSQVVAKELADLLLENWRDSPIVYHGFSVGGYLWGEVLRLCQDHHPHYLPLTTAIRGQILDSGVDVAEIPTAFPSAVLPNNPIMRNGFESLLRFHMKTFYTESTRHYIAARKAFTEGMIRGPVLLIHSDADPLSTRAINHSCRDDFQAKHIQVVVKEFTGSKHVMHYQKHSDEYLQLVDTFLDQLDLTPDGTQSQQTSIKSKL